MQRGIKAFIETLKRKYQIKLLQDDSFKEKLSLKAPMWVFISSFVALMLVVLFIVLLVARYSPLQEYFVTDYNENRRDLVEAYGRIDSLSRLVSDNELYLDNIQGVLSGSVGETIEQAVAREEKQMREAKPATETTELSEDEQVLRDLLLSGTSAKALDDDVGERGISSYTFYSPVKGIVSAQYDEELQHFATDIATKLNEPIKTTLDGHVIFASFTPATGYVIIVQHFDNIISVYKHCAVLLKKVGSFVRGGEVIAMVGNTGELSTGPHLHFELWHYGNPVDAENYITF
ncbi:M23 family metallopeptidase [Albibacterium profundi]|uniref:M23 family metallopeptidase n=1 Tax=Albibacterium profundi TaxID=3134906 RepID=A0ABV5CC70_9SPHI